MSSTVDPINNRIGTGAARQYNRNNHNQITRNQVQTIDP